VLFVPSCSNSSGRIARPNPFRTGLLEACLGAGVGTLTPAPPSRRRWLVFFAASAGTALLAVGFAIAVNHAVASRGAAPRLRTVPASVLARAGYSLAPPSVPPYCGTVQAASVQGWISSDFAGCPISREAAEAAAFPGGGRRVIETLLARVTAAGDGQVGQDRQAWLVVVRYSGLQMPMYLCPVPAIGALCPNTAPGFAATDVIFVDASTGQQIAVVRASSTSTPPAPLRVVPAQTVPVPGAVSPPLIPAPSPSATPR
jgi:hypothetical protein